MSRARAIVPAWLAPWLGLWLAFGLEAAAPLPPPPTRYVADRAGILRPDTREQLSQQLGRFERETSSQIVVWIERKLPADTSLEEHVVAVYRQWKIGQARTNNGVLLAIFVDDRKLRIEVGRGLEGALPDALAGRIIRNEIQPRFRANDYDGGVRAGVAAIIAATRGEYRGTGTTARDQDRVGFGGVMGFLCPFLFIALVVALIFKSSRRGWSYSSRGWGGGWSSGGGGWGGGGSRGSGGGDSGGFSGGGGDSGGGGASGSW